MAEGLRSKARLGPLKDDEKLESLKLAVSYTIATVEIENWSHSDNNQTLFHPRSLTGSPLSLLSQLIEHNTTPDLAT